MQKIIIVIELIRNFWLLNNATNIHVCNYKFLFINYVDYKISFVEATLNDIFSKRETVQKNVDFARRINLVNS